MGISKFFKVVATKLALISVLSCLTPSYASADCCPPPCEDECGGGFWSGKGGALLGGALLGAAAGAAAGAAVASGRRGSRGATGPTGPAGTFPADVGETLTFEFGLTIGVGTIGSVITPFVSAPNGVVTVGTPITVTSLIGLQPLLPIVITDPVFGTYTAGIQVVNAGLAAITTSTLVIDVISSRDATTEIVDLAALSVGLAEQSQISGDFTYSAVVGVP